MGSSCLMKKRYTIYRSSRSLLSTTVAPVAQLKAIVLVLVKVRLHLLVTTTTTTMQTMHLLFMHCDFRKTSSKCSKIKMNKAKVRRKQDSSAWHIPMAVCYPQSLLWWCVFVALRLRLLPVVLSTVTVSIRKRTRTRTRALGSCFLVVGSGRFCRSGMEIKI